jgi:hypothetical protein
MAPTRSRSSPCDASSPALCGQGSAPCASPISLVDVDGLPYSVKCSRPEAAKYGFIDEIR